MTRIVVTTESNDHEGEVWKVYSPITDEEVQYVKPLNQILTDLSYGDLVMSLYDGTIEHAHIVAAEAIPGYFNSHSVRRFKCTLRDMYEEMKYLQETGDEDEFMEMAFKQGLFTRG